MFEGQSIRGKSVRGNKCSRDNMFEEQCVREAMCSRDKMFEEISVRGTKCSRYQLTRLQVV